MVLQLGPLAVPSGDGPDGGQSGAHTRRGIGRRPIAGFAAGGTGASGPTCWTASLTTRILSG